MQSTRRKGGNKLRYIWKKQNDHVSGKPCVAYSVEVSFLGWEIHTALNKVQYVSSYLYAETGCDPNHGNDPDSDTS